MKESTGKIEGQRSPKIARTTEVTAPDTIRTSDETEAQYQKDLEDALAASQKAHISLLESVRGVGIEPESRRQRATQPLTSQARARLIRLEIARRGIFF